MRIPIAVLHMRIPIAIVVSAVMLCVMIAFVFRYDFVADGNNASGTRFDRWTGTGTRCAVDVAHIVSYRMTTVYDLAVQNNNSANQIIAVQNGSDIVRVPMDVPHVPMVCP